MSRKALVGAGVATAVAALYGLSSSKTNNDSQLTSGDAPASLLQLTDGGKDGLGASRNSFDRNNNNDLSSASKGSPSPLVFDDSKSVQRWSAMLAAKLPSLMPLPASAWDYEWDGFKESKNGDATKVTTQQCSTSSTPPVNEAPTATRNLFLIRHGQYHTEQPLDVDRTLTQLGREQLDLTGSRLKELGLPFNRLVASTMTRAQESASIVHGHFPELCMECEPLLEEGAPVRPEPPPENWSPTDDQFREDGARIEAAFNKYFHRASVEAKQDSYELLVCHGNVIRYCVCRALQIPPEAWLRMGLNHGSVTWVSIRPSGRVVLRSLGVTGHMPPCKISSV